MRLLAICVIGFIAVSGFGQGLYGVAHVGSDGMASFYEIDPGTGVATLIGPVGFERCGAIDTDSSGVIYGHAERADGSDTGVLITINPNTGAGTEVGPTGLNSVSDLSFRDDGTLFLYDAANAPTHTLYTVDPGTGVTTLVGDTTLSFASGNGMSFVGSTLYHSQNAGGVVNLNTLDQTLGTASFVQALTIAPPPTNFYRFNGMDVDGGTLYGILNDSTSGGGPSYLATIDTVSGVATIVGRTSDGMDGITSAGIVVPTMSARMMIVFVMLVAVVAVLVKRRM